MIDRISIFSLLRYCRLFLLFTLISLLEFPVKGRDNAQTAASIEEGESSSIGQPLVVDADSGKVWNIFGIKILGKIMADQTDGKYSVVVSTTPPGGGPPLHVHKNEEEFILCYRWGV